MTGHIPDDEDLIGRLRLAVTRLARIIRQQDEAGLTPTESAMLTAIAWEGEPTLGTLAATEHVAPPTVTKTISTLEAAGLIERVADPHDRRVCRVRLSAAGRRRVATYRSRVNSWLAEQADALSGEERAQLAGAVGILEHLVRARQDQRATG